MFDNEDHKIVAFLAMVIAILIGVSVAINVGTMHSCKVQAIAAGMKAQEVQEACK